MDQCWRDLIAVLGAQALNIDLNELITDRENSVIGGKLCGKWPRASKGLYRETARVFILYLNEVLADLDEILKSEHKHIIDIAYLLGAALAGGAKAVEFTKVSGGLAMKLLNGAQYALAVVRPDEAPRLLSSLKPLMRRSPDVFARLLLMAVLANMHRVDVISKLWPLIHGLSNMRQSLSDWGKAYLAILRASVIQLMVGDAVTGAIDIICRSLNDIRNKAIAHFARAYVYSRLAEHNIPGCSGDVGGELENEVVRLMSETSSVDASVLNETNEIMRYEGIPIRSPSTFLALIGMRLYYAVGRLFHYKVVNIERAEDYYKRALSYAEQLVELGDAIPLMVRSYYLRLRVIDYLEGGWPLQELLTEFNKQRNTVMNMGGTITASTKAVILSEDAVYRAFIKDLNAATDSYLTAKQYYEAQPRAVTAAGLLLRLLGVINESPGNEYVMMALRGDISGEALKAVVLSKGEILRYVRPRFVAEYLRPLTHDEIMYVLISDTSRGRTITLLFTLVNGMRGASLAIARIGQREYEGTIVSKFFGEVADGIERNDEELVKVGLLKLFFFHF